MRKSFAEEGDLLFIVEDTRSSPRGTSLSSVVDFIGGFNIVAIVTEKLTWEMAKWEPIFIEIDNFEAEYEVFPGFSSRFDRGGSLTRTTGVGFWTKEDKKRSAMHQTGMRYPTRFDDHPTTLFTKPSYRIRSIDNLSRMSVEQILTHRVANKNFLPHLNKLLKLGLDLESFK